jgi:hypothetical protein
MITALKRGFAKTSAIFAPRSVAAGATVAGVADLAADIARLRHDVGVRHLARDAEGDQSRRMRVDDRRQFRARLVDRLVEGQLGRRLVRTAHRTVRFDADDVLGGQRAFVDAGRGDPDVAVLVADRDVAAGGRRHAAAVDSADDHGDLVSRVHQLRVELLHQVLLRIARLCPWIAESMIRRRPACLLCDSADPPLHLAQSPLFAVIACG